MGNLKGDKIMILTSIMVLKDGHQSNKDRVQGKGESLGQKFLYARRYQSTTRYFCGSLGFSQLRTQQVLGNQCLIQGLSVLHRSRTLGF